MPDPLSTAPTARRSSAPREAAPAASGPAGVPGWLWLALAASVVGGVLRLATLGVQSFWLDEAVTHELVRRSLGGMLRALPHSESTPPLYYVLSWVWVRVFGAGEVGLRSLSAVCGIATIVLLALIARRIGGPRAAIAAAALAAANPLLIWYSQEARAYALLVTLCALSLWFLLRRAWLGFAIAAALALATHYFALFIVLPELGWVAWHHARQSAAAARAIAAVAAVAAALAPLAIVQAGGARASFISASPLATRVAQVPKQFLIGYDTPRQTLLTVAACALALALALGLRRADRGLLALVLCSLGLPLVLVGFGADYLITRNVIAAIVPLVVIAAIAATRLRAGPALVGGLCALGIIAFAGVETDAVYQRDDWRAVAHALGPPSTGPRALVLSPASGRPALAIYAPVVRPPEGAAITTREIDVIDLRRHPPLLPPPPLPAGFASCGPPRRTPEFALARYCAAAPVGVASAALAAMSARAAPALLIDP